MTNISHSNISSQDYKAAFNELSKTIARLNKNSAQHFLNELFSSAEQIMIVKRFGAICMYTHGYTPYRVSNTLGLSRPTASRIFTHYEEGLYDNLIKSFNKREISGFLLFINDLIAAKASPKARARLMNHAGSIGKQ